MVSLYAITAAQGQALAAYMWDNNFWDHRRLSVLSILQAHHELKERWLSVLVHGLDLLLVHHLDPVYLPPLWWLQMLERLRLRGPIITAGNTPTKSNQ